MSNEAVVSPPSSSDEEAIREACEAAAHGDATKVMMALQSRPVAVPSGLDEPLLPVSATCDQLLALLQQDSSPSFHPEHAFRALMSIPCSYETPWRAALRMVEAFHSKSGSLGKQSSGKVLWTCVTDVQSFLQHAVASWWKQERQKSAASSQMRTNHAFPTTELTPRHMLVQLADTALQPLFGKVNDDTKDNRHWTQPLELVTTIVSFCHDLEEASHKGAISDYVLDKLYPKGDKESIRPERLLPWLTLGSDLRSHMRQGDWIRLEGITLDALAQNSHLIPQSDMPGLARNIVSLQDLERPQLLLLHLLYAASEDASTYSTVETVLKSSLASLATPILRQWIRTWKVDASVPRWICANMHLLLLQAVQQSGSQLVSNLVAQALGQKGESGAGLVSQCWESLVQLAFPSQQKPRDKKGTAQNVVEMTRTIMNGVYYTGNGHFSRDEKDTNASDQNLLSTDIVCQSIFLGSTRLSKPSHHVYVSERAQLWVHAADTILRPNPDTTESGPDNFLDILFAILIVVTVYNEVPASRSALVRSTTQSLSGNELGDFPALHCVLVATIVRSIVQNSSTNSGMHELDSLSGVFSQSLAKGVFCDLATALSPLPSSRTALLSTLRKYLQASFGGNLWWGMGASSRGMQENRERIDCALHALCTLLATENHDSWDECGVESWVLLSDIIVQNRPSLPMNERTLLFRRLARFVEHRNFSLDTIDHLLRASLVRLLQYFVAGLDSVLRFVPERAFVVWGSRDALKEGRVHTSQREDLAGLFRLVITLLRHRSVVDGGCMPTPKDSSALFRGRTDILQMLSNYHRRDRPGFDEKLLQNSFDLILEAEDAFFSSIVGACIVAALSSAMSSSETTRPSKNWRNATGDSGIVESWRDKLISAEIDRCKDDHPSSNFDKLLLWAKPSALEGSGGDFHKRSACDAKTTHSLLSLLCDILIDLIFQPFEDAGSSFRTERNEYKRHVVDSMSAIIDIKRGLLTHDGLGFHVEDGDGRDMAFDGVTLCTSAAPYLDILSSIIEDSLDNAASLNMTENLVQSLLTYCIALQQLASDKATDGEAICATRRPQIIRQLWNTYHIVGNEESAKRLVRYLEEKCFSEKLGSASSTETSFQPSLLSITEDEDIDVAVRRIRSTLLATMNAWFGSVSSSTERWSDDIPLYQSDSSSISNERLPVSFWLECLRTFSSDLKAGLDGRSGGMTEQLYSDYLSLIEKSCNRVLQELPHETEMLRTAQISNAVLESASILKAALYSFPLKGATQFKKTMMLSSSELPSMRRQAILIRLATGKDRFPISGCTPLGKDLAIDVFYQMMNVIIRRLRLGLPESGAWPVIAGPHHVDEGGDDESKVDSTHRNEGLSVDSTSGIPSIVVIPNGEPTENETQETSGRQSNDLVQLPSKESWTWASCCSLAAMEKLWTESSSIFQGSVVCFPSEYGESESSVMLSWAPYCTERTDALFNVLSAVCFAMKTFDEVNEAKGSDTALPLAADEQLKSDMSAILATTFPDAVKMRLCIVLEKISVVLQVALRSIVSNLKRADDVDSLIRAECMSCLSSWIRDRPDVLLDIGSGSKRWYQAEKVVNRDVNGSGGAHNPVNPILRRLPKVILRIHELESDLRQLLQVLVKIDKEGNPRQKEIVAQYEALQNPQIDGEISQQSLQSTIRQKLRSYTNARAPLESLGFTLGEESLNDNEANAGRASRKRSRKVLELNRRRNVPRSRNQIVDKWLHLDEDYGMDDGVHDDAYVDLEDFIVDG